MLVISGTQLHRMRFALLPRIPTSDTVRSFGFVVQATVQAFHDTPICQQSNSSSNKMLHSNCRQFIKGRSRNWIDCEEDHCHSYQGGNVHCESDARQEASNANGCHIRHSCSTSQEGSEEARFSNSTEFHTGIRAVSNTSCGEAFNTCTSEESENTTWHPEDATCTIRRQTSSYCFYTSQEDYSSDYNKDTNQQCFKANNYNNEAHSNQERCHDDPYLEAQNYCKDHNRSNTGEAQHNNFSQIHSRKDRQPRWPARPQTRPVSPLARRKRHNRRLEQDGGRHHGHAQHRHRQRDDGPQHGPQHRHWRNRQRARQSPWRRGKAGQACD
ncbi:hypothetical protein DE146DRAFT_428217 [Phaeosphaeria sp. MPI-PUGE-AT-0046c]|nr:hypothetical protein DE146DRAFT_428217 [Phaeosphaeria sp. MPI-PUGE-AT-0046c]